MKNIFNLLTIFLISCSSNVKIIKLEIRENQLFVQNKKIIIENFESEISKITKGLTEEELSEITFSLTIDGESKVGAVTDLKEKIENWKKNEKGLVKRY